MCKKSLSPDFSLFVVFFVCIICVFVRGVKSGLTWIENPKIWVKHRISHYAYTFSHALHWWYIYVSFMRIKVWLASYAFETCSILYCILVITNEYLIHCILLIWPIIMYIVMMMYMTYLILKPHLFIFFLPGAWEQHTQNPSFHNWDLVATHYPAAVQYRTLEVLLVSAVRGGLV